jgi:hypothetical protein
MVVCFPFDGYMILTMPCIHDSDFPLDVWLYVFLLMYGCMVSLYYALYT